MTLNLTTQKINIKGKAIGVPPCTFNYLVTLAKNYPRPVTYKELVAESQGYHLAEIEAQDLSRFQIYLLRKALEENQLSPKYILSVPGYGYRLEA
jgi:DNA-binding response OmpR family regulator